MTEDTLVLAPDQPLSVEVDWSKSNKVAELCQAIVEATAIKLQGRSYIPIEGWQAISAAWGMTPSTEEPVRTEDGYRVKAILRRDSDGAVISTAYGFVGDDEPLWAKRTRHANEGMAQTRAMSRVCANKFRFIPVLMKIENLATTPYEEMPSSDDHPSTSRDPVRRAPERKPAAAAPSQTEPEPPPQKQAPNNHVPQAEGNSSTVVGVVGGCRPSEYEGKKYFWAKVGEKTVFTSEQKLGDDLFAAAGEKVEALVRPGKKPGVYALLDFHFPQ